jgi:hypothetical protein
MTTLAWHGNPALKAEVMARLRTHREQDTIVQGLYQDLDPGSAVGYRGCAIGCTLPIQPGDEHTNVVPPDCGWHAEVERLYGIPCEILWRIDDLFETRDVAEAGQFAVDVIEAIPVGADLHEIARSALHEDDDAGCYGEDTEDGAANLIADLKAAPVPAMAAPGDAR